MNRSFVRFQLLNLRYRPLIYYFLSVHAPAVLQGVISLFFIQLTTEIRDFERSEEIPLQLMVMFRFNYWRLSFRSIHFVSVCICDLFILLASASAICSKMNILISIRESQSVQKFCPTSLGFSHD